MKNKGTVMRLLSYIGRYKLLIPVSLLLSLVATAISLYIPIVIGDAIDLIVGQGAVDLATIGRILLYTAILILIVALSQWIMTMINNKIAYRTSADIRREAFGKIERLPLSYLDRTKGGDIVNRIINDTDRLSEGLLLGFTQVFVGILTIVGTLIFMLVINYKIAITVVVLTPISIFIAKFIGKRTYNMFRERAEKEDEMTTIIDEMVTNQKIVLAFGKEDDVISEFDKVGRELEKKTLSAIFFSSLTNPTTRFVNNLVYAATALVGAFIAILSGGLSIGAFTALLSYTNQYTKPFNEISGIFAEFQNALASAKRVFDFIEETEQTPDSDGAITLSTVTGEVEFSDVSFSYTEDKPLIEGLSLIARSGQRVAIVGPTGAGKTTLINLLMRFYDTKQGSILIDGTPISDIKRESLRESFGMVLQDTWLRAGTVRENIAFGNPDASLPDIINAAKAAHAHSFIRRLEHGYDTVLGEGGEGLSQGQKQLICIARVMLNIPPMLILDEATSSIDTRTEIRIQRAFSEMMQGRTSFVVAHRLSTIREADTILVMNKGRIVEIGNHNELLAKRGFYYELYNSQFAK
ncbi:MAG: ABC transporter ATP-binding protein [Clostridia bacterium]|nr:ABC transporter ATP-binding protein [Clostridia bacterium]